MPLGSSGRTLRLSALAIGALAAPLLISSPASAAGPLGTCNTVGAAGGTVTLTSDCTTSTQIVVPNNTTVDGNGFTITAVDPNGGNFTNAVLRSAPGSPSVPAVLNVKNLNIVANLAVNTNISSLSGLYFDDAGGAVTNVSISGITTSNGSSAGRAVEVRNAAATTAPTLAIDGLKIRNYNKSGVIIYGKTNFTATNMDIGPAGNTDGSPWTGGASNGFTVVTGGTGTITNSTIAGNRYADDTAAGSHVGTGAVLLINAPGVTISGLKVVGTDSDVGLYVQDAAATPVTNVRVTCSSFTRTAGGNADPQFGQAILNDTANAPSVVTAGSNTFSGWSANTSGPIAATTDPSCTAAPPVVAANVSIRSNKARPRKGKNFAIRGLASPALAGVMVTLERQVGNSFRTVAVETLPANGDISFIKKATKRGVKKFRVTVGTGPNYAGGTSNVVKVKTR